MSAAEFRTLLEAGDVTGLRAFWHAVFPRMPQPVNYEQAEIQLHLARTATESIGFKHRAWSHRWLTERLLPSQLPDALRPRAERMYPVVVDGVGVSVNFNSEIMKPAADEVSRGINDAIEDAYAEGRGQDIPFVKTRMEEARAKTMRALFGR